MTATPSNSTVVNPVRAIGSLPPRMKVLFVTTLHRTGGWLAETLAADSASEIVIEESVGFTAGVARLRDEVFDAVLVSHEPAALDALELIEGLRAGGNEEPMIVLGNEPPRELDALCFEVGADAYVCVSQATARSLLWTFARAIQRHGLVRENRRLLQTEKQRLQQEHAEADRLLSQQRALIAELESLHEEPGCEHASATTPVDAGVSLDTGRVVDVGAPQDDACDPAPLVLPNRLVNLYREMLRAYVIMGAGNLSREMTTLAELMATGGMTARQAMQLHVQVLEELIQGLGNRSARHVMNRADLLVLEVLIHLVEGYRQRYLDRCRPPRQLTLPGFVEAVEAELPRRDAA